VTVGTSNRRFDFFRDTFAYRNELVWEYTVDEKTGAMTTRKADPPPTYAHHCFVVVRAARQFFFHARFEPNQPRASAADCLAQIRAVIARSPYFPSADSERIAIPGYDGLRAFSGDHEDALKANCGGAWHSYINRRHWRMLYPFRRDGQAFEAERLRGEIARGRTPIVHVVRFPQLTINHALLVIDSSETEQGLDFVTYDPNLPQGPSVLHFRAHDKSFHLPRNIYWPGGIVNVYETYTGRKFERFDFGRPPKPNPKKSSPQALMPQM
jgi:hypothetical protein